MASPVDANRAAQAFTAVTPWVMTLPTGIVSGDLLILYARTGGAANIAVTGWTMFASGGFPSGFNTADATDDSTYLLYRWADGTEGTTLNVAPSVAIKGAAVIWRVTGAANPATRTPEASTVQVFTTAANAGDAPAISPTGGSKDYLFLAGLGLGGVSPPTSLPAGYSNYSNIASSGGSAATNCVIAYASRQATTATEDTGAWQHPAATTGGCAFTIAIHPGNVTVTPGAAIATGSAVAPTARTISNYGAVVLANGAVGYWKMSEAAAPLADSSGGGLSLSQVFSGHSYSQAALVAGDPDGAAKLAAAGYWERTDDARLDLGDVLTVEAWIKRNAAPDGAYHGIVSKQNGAYYLRLNTANQLELVKSQVALIATSTATITDQAAHHVVATKNGATVKLYLDGVDVTGTVTNSTLADNTNTFRVGYDVSADAANLTFDEVAVYPVALTSTQVANHYTLGSAAGPVNAAAAAATAYGATLAPAATVRVDGTAALAAGAALAPVARQTATTASALAAGSTLAPAARAAALPTGAVAAGATLAPALRAAANLPAALAVGAASPPAPASTAAAGLALAAGATLAPAARDTAAPSSAVAVGVTATPTASGGTAAFAPTDIAGLAVWLDASQLALADGAAVTVWPDLSGANHPLSPSGVPNTPVCKTNILNGRSVVRFDGVDDEMLVTNVTAFAYQHFFVVAKFRLATWPDYCGLLSNNSGHILIGDASSGNRFYAFPQTAVYRRNGVVDISAQAPMQVWENMGLEFAAPLPADYFKVGLDRVYPPRYWDGDIAEVIGYDHALTGTERVQVEQYLQEKWFGAAAPVNAAAAPAVAAGSSLSPTLRATAAPASATAAGVVPAATGVTGAAPTIVAAPFAVAAGAAVAPAAQIGRAAAAALAAGTVAPTVQQIRPLPFAALAVGVTSAPTVVAGSGATASPPSAVAYGQTATPTPQTSRASGLPAFASGGAAQPVLRTTATVPASLAVAATLPVTAVAGIFALPADVAASDRPTGAQGAADVSAVRQAAADLEPATAGVGDTGSVRVTAADT